MNAFGPFQVLPLGGGFPPHQAAAALGGAVAVNGFFQPATPIGGGAAAHMHGLQPYQPAPPIIGGAAARMHGLQPYQPAPPVGGGSTAHMHGFQPHQQAEPQFDQNQLATCPLLRLVRLREADRHQRQLLRAVQGQWLRQVGFTERQAAAAAQATMAMPQDAAQLLQREAFERNWQQLDAAWRQAQAAEQAAWMQLRREQWQDLLEIWDEQEASWRRSLHEQELRWHIKKGELQATWEATVQERLRQVRPAPAAGQPAQPPQPAAAAEAAGTAPAPPPQQAAEAGPVPAAQPAQAAVAEPVAPPANGGQQALQLPSATVPAAMPMQLRRQEAAAASSKRKEPEAAAGEGEGEADESPSPGQAEGSTPLHKRAASSPAATLPRRLSAEASRLLPLATLDPADLITLAASSMVAWPPHQPAATPAAMGPQQAGAQPPAAQQAQQMQPAGTPPATARP